MCYKENRGRADRSTGTKKRKTGSAEKMNKLTGRVAIVTGGGNGMGEAVARQLAAEGASVLVNDLGVWNEGGIRDADRVAADIVAAGGVAVADYSDVSRRETAANIVDAAIRAFGKIDILCLIAGTTSRAPIDEMTEEQFDRLINVNLKQCYNICHDAVKYMKQQKYGRIVIFASRGAFGNPDSPTRSCGYSAAKAGAIGFASELSLELRGCGDFRVNCVMPAAQSKLFPNAHKAAYGGVPSPWPSTPDMVAPMTAYLCLEECEADGELFYIAGTDVGLYQRDRKVLLDLRRAGGAWDVDELCSMVPQTFGWYLATRPEISEYDQTAGNR